MWARVAQKVCTRYLLFFIFCVLNCCVSFLVVSSFSFNFDGHNYHSRDPAQNLFLQSHSSSDSQQHQSAFKFLTNYSCTTSGGGSISSSSSQWADVALSRFIFLTILNLGLSQYFHTSTKFFYVLPFPKIGTLLAELSEREVEILKDNEAIQEIYRYRDDQMTRSDDDKLAAGLEPLYFFTNEFLPSSSSSHIIYSQVEVESLLKLYLESSKNLVQILSIEGGAHHLIEKITDMDSVKSMAEKCLLNPHVLASFLEIDRCVVNSNVQPLSRYNIDDNEKSFLFSEETNVASARLSLHEDCEVMDLLLETDESKLRKMLKIADPSYCLVELQIVNDYLIKVEDILNNMLEWLNQQTIQSLPQSESDDSTHAFEHEEFDKSLGQQLTDFENIVFEVGDKNNQKRVLVSKIKLLMKKAKIMVEKLSVERRDIVDQMTDVKDEATKKVIDKLLDYIFDDEKVTKNNTFTTDETIERNDMHSTSDVTNLLIKTLKCLLKIDVNECYTPPSPSVVYNTTRSVESEERAKVDFDYNLVDCSRYVATELGKLHSSDSDVVFGTWRYMYDGKQVEQVENNLLDACRSSESSSEILKNVLLTLSSVVNSKLENAEINHKAFLNMKNVFNNQKNMLMEVLKSYEKERENYQLTKLLNQTLLLCQTFLKFVPISAQDILNAHWNSSVPMHVAVQFHPTFRGLFPNHLELSFGPFENNFNSEYSEQNILWLIRKALRNSFLRVNNNDTTNLIEENMSPPTRLPIHACFNELTQQSEGFYIAKDLIEMFHITPRDLSSFPDSAVDHDDLNFDCLHRMFSVYYRSVDEQQQTLFMSIHKLFEETKEKMLHTHLKWEQIVAIKELQDKANEFSVQVTSKFLKNSKVRTRFSSILSHLIKSHKLKGVDMQKMKELAVLQKMAIVLRLVEILNLSFHDFSEHVLQEIPDKHIQIMFNPTVKQKEAMLEMFKSAEERERGSRRRGRRRKREIVNRNDRKDLQILSNSVFFIYFKTMSVVSQVYSSSDTPDALRYEIDAILANQMNSISKKLAHQIESSDAKVIDSGSLQHLWISNILDENQVNFMSLEVLKLQLKVSKQMVLLLNLTPKLFRLNSNVLPQSVEFFEVLKKFLFEDGQVDDEYAFSSSIDRLLIAVNTVYNQLRRTLSMFALGRKLTPKQTVACKSIISTLNNKCVERLTSILTVDDLQMNPEKIIQYIQSLMVDGSLSSNQIRSIKEVIMVEKLRATKQLILTLDLERSSFNLTSNFPPDLENELFHNFKVDNFLVANGGGGPHPSSTDETSAFRNDNNNDEGQTSDCKVYDCFCISCFHKMYVRWKKEHGIDSPTQDLMSNQHNEESVGQDAFKVSTVTGRRYSKTYSFADEPTTRDGFSKDSDVKIINQSISDLIDLRVFGEERSVSPTSPHRNKTFLNAIRVDDHVTDGQAVDNSGWRNINLLHFLFKALANEGQKMNLTDFERVEFVKLLERRRNKSDPISSEANNDEFFESYLEDVKSLAWLLQITRQHVSYLYIPRAMSDLLFPPSWDVINDKSVDRTLHALFRYVRAQLRLRIFKRLISRKDKLDIIKEVRVLRTSVRDDLLEFLVEHHPPNANSSWTPTKKVEEMSIDEMVDLIKSRTDIPTRLKRKVLLKSLSKRIDVYKRVVERANIARTPSLFMSLSRVEGEGMNKNLIDVIFPTPLHSA